jgi:hypothetical protein
VHEEGRFPRHRSGGRLAHETRLQVSPNDDSQPPGIAGQRTLTLMPVAQAQCPAGVAGLQACLSGASCAGGFVAPVGAGGR